jgi:ribose transport system substrate-binding protein
MRKVLLAAAMIVVLLGTSLLVSADNYKIGINNFGQANFFGRIGRTVLINVAEALGAQVISTVTDNVPDRISAIENFIVQGVDAIIIQEGDIKMAAPALEEAKRLGILIASMDAGTAPFVDLVVESNNWVMGAMAATELMNRTGGQAKIVLITNPLGQMIRMRAGELQLVLTEYPDSEILYELVYAWPDFFSDILAKMESVLTANPSPGSLNAVFATFDGVAVAAAAAIREAGRQDQFVIVGVDGDPQAYEEMAKPDSPLVATVAQQPWLMAETLVKQVFTLLNGEELPSRHTYIASRLVTKEGLPPQSEWPYAENYADYGKDATLD